MVGGGGGKCSDSGLLSRWFADRFAMGEKEFKLEFIPLASVTQRMKFPSTKTGKHCTRESQAHISGNTREEKS